MSKTPTQDDLDTYNRVVSDFTRTRDMTDTELSATIKVLGFKHPDAYDYLRFVDAYMELRNRKDRR